MDFRHPHFAEPAWLLLAVLAPLALIALQAFARQARRKQLALFATPEQAGELLRFHSSRRRWFKEILLVVAVAIAGLALARPQWGESREVAAILGEDILFVLDCSKSMLANDVPPNRLIRAKFAIQDFVQKHGRGRVGLIAFSGQAFLQCPLTFDYDAFREALNAVDEKTIPVGGTDIGRALDEGFQALEKNSRHKVMILVTDGEDLEKSGVAEARKLATNGVVIYTVGVGTAQGSTIQVANERGQAELVHARNGEVVQSKLDEATLMAIAEATHGSYHPLGALGDGISRIRQSMESAEAQSEIAQSRKLGIDRFYFPTAVILFLLVIESLIGTRRSTSGNTTKKRLDETN